MPYTLSGFKQIENIRHYRFDGVNADRSRQQFVVGVDIELIRRYRIQLQELPLLCRAVLERGEGIQSMIFSEADMQRYADERTTADAEALKRRQGRKEARLDGSN